MFLFPNTRANRKKLQVIILLLSCLVFLGGSLAVNAEEVSLAEQEDLGFIQNLFQDKAYSFAKQEAEIFRKSYPESPLLPEVILIQAQINVADRSLDLALRQYEKIIQQYPKSKTVEDALYFSGALRIQLNQDDGPSYFDRLTKQFPNSKYLPGIAFHRGQRAFTKKQWNQGEIFFKNVLKGEGISEEQILKSHHYLAWIYYFQEKTLLAKSLFFELLESKLAQEDKAKIAYQLGVDAQRKGRFKKAISWFEKQMEEWPHPDFQNRSRFWIAESLYQIFKNEPATSTEKDKEKAIRLYSENLRLKTPISPYLSRYHRGWLEVALKRSEKAEIDFAWLQASKFDYAADIEITATRTAYLEKSGQLSKANEVYANALEYQKEPMIRSLLLISLIRNSHRLKDCPAVIKWSNRSEFPQMQKDLAEISFYAGQCHYANQSWLKAGKAFSQIPLDSQYGKAVFSNYLNVFRQTRNLSGGLNYLSKVEKHPDYGSLETILLLKIDLCKQQEEWVKSFVVMQRMEKEVPSKSADPWFLLNMAKTADQISSSAKNKTADDYPKLALYYYQKAYNLLPHEDSETKLSLLDILINRYLSANNHQKVVQLYQDAIKLVKERHRKDELRLLVAKIQLQKLGQKELAQKELLKIHKGGDSNIHYEASSLLAELYVGQKALNKAISILKDLASQKIQKGRWYPVTHFRLAELYQAQESWKLAVKHYELVIHTKQKTLLKQQAKERATAIKKYLAQ